MQNTAGTKLLLTCGPGSTVASHGDILVLDWEQKCIIDKLRFKHNVYDESQKGLAGASWHGEKLLVAAECELLECSVAPLQLIEARTFPFLNDVHHLAARNGNIWVCNTGLDCVEVFDADWNLIETKDILGSLIRRLRYSYTSLYYTVKRGYEQLRGWRPPYSHLDQRPLFPNARKLLMKNAYRRKEQELRFSLFRPHILHPNHVLVLERDIWITINTTGEILSLQTGKIIADGLGRRIHDGMVKENEHYVTNANSNRIIVHEFDSEGPSLGKTILDKCVTSSRGEGFLRGLAVVGNLVFAGLSARRGPPSNYKSARIIALDRATLEPLDEWDIPEEYGTQVFTVLDASHNYA